MAEALKVPLSFERRPSYDELIDVTLRVVLMRFAQKRLRLIERRTADYATQLVLVRKLETEIDAAIDRLVVMDVEGAGPS